MVVMDYKKNNMSTDRAPDNKKLMDYKKNNMSTDMAPDNQNHNLHRK
jgi:hypothetical protein